MRKLLPVFVGILLHAVPSHGVLVNPVGVIEEIVADPTRSVFYVSLANNEMVIVSVAGAVSNRVTVSGNPNALAVARDGSALYVALLDTHDVAVYDLPLLTYRETWDLSATSGPTGLAEKAGRLYAVSNEGLSIVDTASGEEIYFDEPPGPGSSYFRASSATLSPDGTRLYALNSGLSPASLYVFDVSTDSPVYFGEECCHSCIGSDGRQLVLSPDGKKAYVVTSSPYWIKVLSTDPLLNVEAAIATGAYPGTVALSANGSYAYVGWGDPEFAVVRTSDWLPFHVGALQGDVVYRGLVLSSNQTTLAAVIEYQSFDPNRIELVSVASPAANRGGVRVRPLDQPTGVPVPNAYLGVQPSQSDGTSAYVDVRPGYVGRTMLAPGQYQIELSASGHVTQSFPATVAAGSWLNLGNVQLARNGAVPSISDVCVSPQAFVGGTTALEVHGRGFLPDAILESTDAGVVVDSFEFVDWATIRATVTVDPAEAPGLFNYAKVTNPGPDFEYGYMLLRENLFADGFEGGDPSHWSLTTP